MNYSTSASRVADDDYESDLGGCKIGRKQLMWMKATSGMQRLGRNRERSQGKFTKMRQLG